MAETTQLSSKDKLLSYTGRLQDLTQKAIKADLKLSKDMKKLLDKALAQCLAYEKTMALADVLNTPMPSDVDDTIVKTINDVEDQMTLDLSYQQ